MSGKSVAILSLGAVILAVYFTTLSPSIAGGDSGEIVAEGCHLGTAHPPGYPLMTLLINTLANLSTIGSVAYRINLFSASCTSLAAVIMGYVVIDLSPNKSVIGAILGMAMFAFSPLIWQYAITAEVFPLNTLFAAAIVGLVVKFNRERSVGVAYFGAFLCGLAVCNQHTIILFEVPLILWMLFLLRKKIMEHPWILLWLSLSFLAGLLPYLYLPIAATLAPKAGSWGHVTTMEGFLHHFLRKDYGTFQLFSGASGRNAEGLWARNTAYLKDLTVYQGLYIAPVLAVLGILSSILTYDARDTNEVATDITVNTITNTTTNPTATSQQTKGKKSITHTKQQPKSTKSSPLAKPSSLPSLLSWDEYAFLPAVLLVTVLFYFFVFHTLSNLPLSDRLLYGVHQRFWMQPNVLVFIWCGIGYNGLIYTVERYLLQPPQHKKPLEASSSPSSMVTTLFTLLMFLAAVGMSGVQVWKWYTVSNQAQDGIHFQQYAKAVLSSLPENSLLFINYDQQWTSVRYMQICEQYRTDVTSIQLSMATYQWFQYKRSLYDKKNIIFPGTFMTYPKSPLLQTHHAFTLKQFLDVNVVANTSASSTSSGSSSGVFLGGKVSYPDPEITQLYDSVPYGLISQFVLLTSLPKPHVYHRDLFISWKHVLEHLPIRALPSIEKYPEETWEWTIGRDFKDRLTESGAFLLHVLHSNKAAIETFPQALIDAIYWLETAYQLEGTQCASNLLKNLGLAYIDLLQCKSLGQEKYLSGPSEDIFDTFDTLPSWPSNNNGEDAWKQWAMEQFTKYWGLYLQRPDAKGDPQYATIKNAHSATLKTLEQLGNNKKKNKK